MALVFGYRARSFGSVSCSACTLRVDPKFDGMSTEILITSQLCAQYGRVRQNMAESMRLNYY